MKKLLYVYRYDDGSVGTAEDDLESIDEYSSSSHDGKIEVYELVGTGQLVTTRAIKMDKKLDRPKKAKRGRPRKER